MKVWAKIDIEFGRFPKGQGPVRGNMKKKTMRWRSETTKTEDETEGNETLNLSLKST